MRRLKMLLGVGVCLVGLSACHGTVSTTSVTAAFTCTSSTDPLEAPWSATISFSLDTPKWATTGSTIDLANLKLPPGFTNTSVTEVDVDPEGLASFTQPDVPTPIGHANAFFGSDSQPFPTVSTPLTGAIGDQATLDVTGVTMRAVVANHLVETSCIPTDATPVRIASIYIEAPINN